MSVSYSDDSAGHPSRLADMAKRSLACDESAQRSSPTVEYTFAPLQANSHAPHLRPRCCASVVCRARRALIHASMSSGLYRTAFPILMNGGPSPLKRQFASVCFDILSNAAARVVSMRPGGVDGITGAGGDVGTRISDTSLLAISKREPRKDSRDRTPSGVSTRTRKGCCAGCGLAASVGRGMKQSCGWF